MTTAISPTRVARTVGVGTFFKNLKKGGFGLQQRIMVLAQGSTASVGFSLTKAQVFSAQEAATTYGQGSPIHEICLRLLPPTGDGVGDIPVTIYPLADGTTEAAGTITPAGSPTADGTYFVKMNNRVTASFVILASASVADATALITTAINAALDLPATAVDGTTLVDVDAKWKGLTGDDIVISVEGPALGMTFGLVQPTGGAGNPTVDAALAQVGDVFETLLINALGADTPALTAIAAHNEGQWAAEVRKPLAGAFYGINTASVTTAIVVPDARKTDRTNSQLVSPGSTDLPWAIAARELVSIALIANSASPGRDYARQEATGLVPGADGDQWTSAERQTAILGGSSTIEVRDSVVTLSDTVTMYHPTGDPTPAYRYVVDIVKLQNLLSDVGGVFDSTAWAGAELLPDDQATTSATAKKPRMATAAVKGLIDDWALRALISDPGTAKESIVSNISPSNPKRLDIAFTVQLSGNANVISIDLNFGFFFGTV